MFRRGYVHAIVLLSLPLLTGFDLTDLIPEDNGTPTKTLKDGTSRFEIKGFGNTSQLLITNDLSRYRVKHCAKFEPLKQAQRNEHWS